jgi:hypothetical protein
MVDMTAPYAGDFVRADELPEKTQILVVIRFATVEQIGQDQQLKAVLSLASAQTGQPWPRKLVLNKTNALSLTAAFGKDSTGWVNQPITVWREPVMFGGKMVPGIKVAAGHPTGGAAAVPMPGPLHPPPSPAPSPAPSSAASTAPGNGAAAPSQGHDPTGTTANMAGHTVPLPTGMPSAPPSSGPSWAGPGSDLDDQIPF